MELDQVYKDISTISAELKEERTHWLTELNSKVDFSGITLKLECENQNKSVFQDIITGKVELIPVQKWFFDQGKRYLNHYGQSVMLYNKNGFDVEIVKKVFKKLVTHHDALRMGYRTDSNPVIQYNNGLESELFSLEVYDIRNYVNPRGKLRSESSLIQENMDLSRGPLVKLAIFRIPDGEYLLINIHKLVIDGKSWEILLEDVRTGFEQAIHHENIKFQDKTSPFIQWASKINEHTRDWEIQRELAYWQEVESFEMPTLPKDSYTEDHLHKNSKTMVESLSQEETKNLLTKTGYAYNTEVNDILVTALGLVIERWTGIQKVLVMLEDDGRKIDFSDVNVSRTVGCFNTFFPFVIDTNHSDHLPRLIKTIKESLRYVPHSGIGYGLLKYFSPGDNKEEARLMINPEISFRYLGILDNEAETKYFTISEISYTDNTSPNLKRRFTLDISVVIVNGRLTFSFNYNEKEYSDDTIQRLMNEYKEQLIHLISHCMGKKKVEMTPSDYGNKGLTLDEFEKIKLKYTGIKRITALSPLKEGILFHYLKEKNTPAYFEQFSFYIQGKIDIQLLSESYRILIKRHDILRTVIVYENVKKPQEIIFMEPIPDSHLILSQDISYMSASSQSTFTDMFTKREREMGFDISNEILMHIRLLKIAQNHYKMVWSYHLIAINSWCAGVLIRELFSIYNVLKNNMKAELKLVQPFSSYVGWMDIQDDEGTYEYWKKHIAACTSTLLQKAE